MLDVCIGQAMGRRADRGGLLVSLRRPGLLRCPVGTVSVAPRRRRDGSGRRGALASFSRHLPAHGGGRSFVDLSAVKLRTRWIVTAGNLDVWRVRAGRSPVHVNRPGVARGGVATDRTGGSYNARTGRQVSNQRAAVSRLMPAARSSAVHADSRMPSLMGQTRRRPGPLLAVAHAVPKIQAGNCSRSWAMSGTAMTFPRVIGLPGA